MGAIIGALVTWVLSFFFKRPAPVSPEAQQAAQAAAWKTQLATEETTNAQVAQAIQATRQSDAALAAHPDELRQPSADSRD